MESATTTTIGNHRNTTHQELDDKHDIQELLAKAVALAEAAAAAAATTDDDNHDDIHDDHEDSSEEHEDHHQNYNNTNNHHPNNHLNNHDEEQALVLDEQDSCDHNPEFGVICSFISKFGDLLDLSLNIEQLRAGLENRHELDEELVNLHVKLLKKTCRYFVRDQWEKALIRFASAYSYEDSYALETYGYLKTRPSIKLELLKRLLDAQFDCDEKFKSALNNIEAADLRVPPAGRDVNGNSYWLEVDSEGSLRVFHEQPLELDSWKTVCHTNDDLELLIKELEQSQDLILKGEPLIELELEPYNPLPVQEPIASDDDDDDDYDYRVSRDKTLVEPVIMTRTRAAKKNLNYVDDAASGSDEGTIVEEDQPCGRCGKSNFPEWILLCDGCDAGYHTSCCLPPLRLIPEGDWFCPRCEHRKLLIKLRDVHFNNSLVLKIKAREKAKKERLRQLAAKKEAAEREAAEKEAARKEAAKIQAAKKQAARENQAQAPKKRPAPIVPEYDDSILAQGFDDESEQESVAVSNYSDDLTDAELSNDSEASNDTDASIETKLSGESDFSIETGLSEETELSNETETSIDELIDLDGYRKRSGGGGGGAGQSRKKKMKKRNSYESDDSDWEPSRTRQVASIRISYKESSDKDELEDDVTEPNSPASVAGEAKQQPLATSADRASPLQEKDQVEGWPGVS